MDTKNSLEMSTSPVLAPVAAENVSVSPFPNSNEERATRAGPPNIISVGVKLRSEDMQKDDTNHHPKLIKMDLNKPLTVQIEELIDQWNLKATNPDVAAEDFAIAREDDLGFVTDANKSKLTSGSVLLLIPSAARAATMLVDELKQCSDPNQPSGEYTHKLRCLEKMCFASRDYSRARELITAGAHVLLVDIIIQLANDICRVNPQNADDGHGAAPPTATTGGENLPAKTRHSRTKSEDIDSSSGASRQTRQDGFLWQGLVMQCFSAFEMLASHDIIQYVAIDKRLITTACKLIGHAAVTDENLKIKLLLFLQRQLEHVPASIEDIETNLSVSLLLSNNLCRAAGLQADNSIMLREVKLNTLKLINSMIDLSPHPHTYYKILMQPKQRELILNYLLPVDQHNGSDAFVISISDTPSHAISTVVPSQVSNSPAAVNSTIISASPSITNTSVITASANMRTIRRETKSLTKMLGRIQQKSLLCHVNRLIPLVSSTLPLELEQKLNEIRAILSSSRSHVKPDNMRPELFTRTNIGPLVLLFIHYYAVSQPAEFARWLARNQAAEDDRRKILSTEQKTRRDADRVHTDDDYNECPFLDAAFDVTDLLVEAFQLDIFSKKDATELKGLPKNVGGHRRARIKPVFLLSSPDAAEASMPLSHNSAINLSTSTAEVIGPAKHGFPESSGCCRMLFTHNDSLNELFCILMRCTAKTWHETHASVMAQDPVNEFEAVMSCVREQFNHAITKNVPSLIDFAKAMEEINYNAICALRKQDRSKNEDNLKHKFAPVIELANILRPRMMQLVARSRLEHMRQGTSFMHRFSLITATTGKPVKPLCLLSTSSQQQQQQQPVGEHEQQTNTKSSIESSNNFVCRLSPLDNFLCFGATRGGGVSASTACDELPYRIAVSSLCQLLVGDDVPALARSREILLSGGKKVGNMPSNSNAFSLAFRMPASAVALMGDTSLTNSASANDLSLFGVVDHGNAAAVDSNAMQIVHVDFVAQNEREFETWTDGIRALLHEPLKCRSSLQEADVLLALELKVRLLELAHLMPTSIADGGGGGAVYENVNGGVSDMVPEKCPAAPPLPANFDFFY